MIHQHSGTLLSAAAAAASLRQVLISGLGSSKPLPPLTVRLLHGRLLRLDLLDDLSGLLLRALSSSGLHLHALSLHSLGIPDEHPHITLPFALKSASRLPSALPVGEQLHARSLKLPSHSNPDVLNSLLNLYKTCGLLDRARAVFDEMRCPGTVPCSALINAYIDAGLHKEAVAAARDAFASGMCRPNSFTAIRVLRACAGVVDLEAGEAAWRAAERAGISTNLVVATAALNLYAKCGEMAKAREVFDNMPRKYALAWGVLVKGYVSNGYSREAVNLFFAMQTQGVRPDCHTVAAVLTACKRLGALDLGQQVVRVVDWDEFLDNPVLGTALIRMYAKCGSTRDAWVVFQQMRERDIVAWNTMIFVLRVAGHGKVAFAIVAQMLKSGMQHYLVDLDGVGMTVAPESANTSPAATNRSGCGRISQSEGCANGNTKYIVMPRKKQGKETEKKTIETPKALKAENGGFKNQWNQKKFIKKNDEALDVERDEARVHGETHHSDVHMELAETIQDPAIDTVMLQPDEGDGRVKPEPTSQSEGCANGNTKYIVMPRKKQGKETEKKTIETPKALKAENGGFKNQWNQKKFIKKNDEALDVERDEARVHGETHHSDVHMELAETIQDPAIDTVMLQPDEGDGRVKPEPTRVANRYVFKSRLHEYTQKAGLMMPEFQTLKEGPSHEPVFKSTVLINNAKYESVPGLFSWNSAEESAAEVALMEIGKSVVLPTNLETGRYKILLQEYAQKMNYALPSYICNKQISRVRPFRCTVEIGGIQYIGATASTKKQAEIKAARTALLAIQGQSEGCANDNTKYSVVPGKRQGKEREKTTIETPKALKAKNGGFKNQRNQKKFIKKNDEALDVERDEARVHGETETHHSDVHMELAETIQDPSIDTVILQPNEGDERVKPEPTSDTTLLQSDGEGRKVEQESPSGVRRFGGRAPWSLVFEKFKILSLKIQEIAKKI